MESLKEVLIRRDGMTENDAIALINDARADLFNRLDSGEFVDDANFCNEWFGLEPDYIMDIM